LNDCCGTAWLGLLAAVLTLAVIIFPAAAETLAKTRNSKPYEIIFKGNAAISEAALRQDVAGELEAFNSEGQRPADIDDAAFQMQIAYRKEGYAFAAVDYQIETKQDFTTVTFLISEGPRVIVRNIVFAGNQALDDNSLKVYFEKLRKGLLVNGLLGQGELVFIRSEVETAIDEIRQR